MSGPLLHRLSSHRRAVTIIAAASALVAGGVFAVATAAQADPAAPASSSSCSTATLKGTYLFAGNGTTVTATSSTPTAFAGSERFNGRGGVTGSSTFSSGGTIFPRSPFTGTYTVAADCTGTLTIGTALHFDIYLAPSGDTFAYVQTDVGSVSAVTETRVSRS